jgi:hypothetical protein
VAAKLVVALLLLMLSIASFGIPRLLPQVHSPRLPRKFSIPRFAHDTAVVCTDTVSPLTLPRLN